MLACYERDASARVLLLAVSDSGIDATTAMLRPQPIVLVPAFHATTMNGWRLERVQEILGSNGQHAYLASIPPYASTPARSNPARIL